MWYLNFIAVILGLCRLVEASIWQNDQVLTAVDASKHGFRTFPADAPELSYKGRWDSRKVSWWS